MGVSVTLVLWVMIFPNRTGGAPLVLLALLLGAGVCSWVVSTGLDATESVSIEDVGIGWLTCGSIEDEVSRNTLSDVWPESSI